jgi:DNA-binding beta-propeller fold protein YncE
VVGDVDKTISVVDVSEHPAPTRTAYLPASLQGADFKPHDVFVDEQQGVAFVSVLATGRGYVVRYDARSLEPTAIAELGGDPHLWFDARANVLYVPAQDDSTVSFLDGTTLEPLRKISVPNAHGAFLERSRRFFFTTNIAGGGAGGLVMLDTRTGETSAFDTPFPVPHNITAGPGARTLFVTHSGATASTVSVFTRNSRGLSLLRTVPVGLNPFGLAFVSPDE